MRNALGSVPRDVHVLVLFDEIYRTQSMTRAAERLELSQPTASIWLAKLRREWGDPLFVRTSSGMQPTPRADALIVIGDGSKAARLVETFTAEGKPVLKARMQPRQDKRWLSVLPVIGLKVLSFAQQGGESRSRVLALNLSFSIGLLAVFVALASLAAFAQLGWGE